MGEREYQFFWVLFVVWMEWLANVRHFRRRKDEDTSNEEFVHWYKPYIVMINNDREKPPHILLQMERTKQVMVQFLWRKQATFEKNYQDKFLLLIHEECKF